MKVFNEEDIVSRLREVASRREAFAAVVREYSPSLYWQVRRMVTYHDDADDVMQNVWLKAWSGLDGFRGDARLSTWLHRIAYNETLTFLNRQRETLSLDTAIGEEDNEEGTLTIADRLEGDTYFDGEAAEAMLQAAVACLPAKQRAVFVMKYFDEMKYEDMSAVTGTSVGALKASYHLAVKKICRQLNLDGGAESE